MAKPKYPTTKRDPKTTQAVLNLTGDIQYEMRKALKGTGRIEEFTDAVAGIVGTPEHEDGLPIPTLHAAWSVAGGMVAETEGKNPKEVHLAVLQKLQKMQIVRAP